MYSFKTIQKQNTMRESVFFAPKIGFEIGLQ